MNQPWRQLKRTVGEEWSQLTHMKPNSRPWEMALAASIASGVPLLVGVAFGRFDFGVISMLGGLVFLSLPDTPLRHRMVLIMAVAFGTIACYALGALTHFFPPLMIVVLTLICVVASMTARYYRLAPPGIIFMVMAAAIAAYTPVSLPEIPQRVGLVTLGALFACIVAFLYSLYRVRRAAPSSQLPMPGMDFDYVIVDSVIIGGCVGLSLALAELLQLQRPYWVPVSCLAIIQGAGLRMVWQRHLHRVFGTVVGLALAWLLLALPLDLWETAMVMIGLSLVIEMLVVRNYGLAVIFITPLTVFLAETTQTGQQTTQAIMLARVLDIALGSFVGLLGGAALHLPAVRTRVARGVRALLPARGRQAL